MTKISIVIPIYNGESTLEEVFKGLEGQDNKELVHELILINDQSSDSSQKVNEQYAARSSYKVKMINHPANKGLAATYNEGLRISSTDLVVIMHQDIFLKDKSSFRKLTRPFHDPGVLATHPYFVYPYSVWIKDGFWQKALFSRLVDKKVGKLNGKFDCINRSAGIFFDEENYRTAGEDFDFEIRIKEKGMIKQADLEVIHLQDNDPLFSVRKLIKKEAQLAECYGVNVRRYLGQMSPVDILLVIFRPLLLIGLFINFAYINVISLLLLITFIFIYTGKVYLACWKDPRVIVLPIVNVFNTIVYSAYFILGLVRGRQTV